MSRIHEALKRAEKEKGKPLAEEPLPASPKAIAPPAAQAAPAASVPATAPAVRPVARPAVPSVPAASPAGPVDLPPPPAPVTRIVPRPDSAELARAAAFSAASSAPVSEPSSLLANCRRTRWQGDASKLFLLNSEAPSRATEELRGLCARLNQERERRSLKTLLFTSALPAEGKTFVCANLGLALARQTDKRILLIDCDLRSPSLHAILGAPGEPGLAACLRNEAKFDQVLERGPLDNLFLIPGGKETTDPTALLARGRMKALLAQLAPLFDWILLDAPAAAPFDDALTVAQHSDGVVLVVRGGVAAHDSARGAISSLRDRRLLGVVLNRVPSSRAAAV